MANLKKENFIALLVISLIITIIESLVFLPWWTFIIMLIISGVLMSYFQWQVKSFQTGFSAGFLVWTLKTLFLNFNGNGIILTKVGLLLSLPSVIVILITGLTGGIIVGLALFTGTSILKNRGSTHKDNGGFKY